MAWVTGYELREITEGHPDRKFIHSTMKPFTVVKAYKVCNSEVYTRYKQQRELMFYEGGGKEKVLEKHLFHGSPFTEKITKEGFNLSLANPRGNHGAGIYLGADCTTSRTYSKGSGKMLVCRVALGKVFVGEGSSLPPGYHTLHNGSMYVIYNQNQVYPGFLVEYQ